MIFLYLVFPEENAGGKEHYVELIEAQADGGDCQIY
jgi:hypothetical protein